MLITFSENEDDKKKSAKKLKSKINNKILKIRQLRCKNVEN